MTVQEGYCIAKRAEPSELSMDIGSIYEYQRAIIIESSPNSVYVKGDEVFMADNSFFDKAPNFSDDSYYIYEEEIRGVIRDGVIHPSASMVYVNADKDKKSVRNGIHIDTRYNPMDKDNITQDGVVYSACFKAFNSYYGNEIDVEVKPGDVVYTHHFLTHEDNERVIGDKTYYEIKYEDLYCKISDNEIEMLNEWNLVTAIDKDIAKTDNGIMLEVMAKKEARTAIVQHPNRKSGLYPGDKVLFKTGREYEITIGIHTYYRINTKDIIYNLDKMKALGTTIVVEPIRKAMTHGQIVVSTKEEAYPEKGKVISVPEGISSLKEGDEILFRKGTATHVDIEEKECMLMDIKNVYVVL